MLIMLLIGGYEKMLVVKIVDMLLYFIQEVIYLGLYVCAICLKWGKEYSGIIIIVVLFALFLFGGMYAYELRMAQVYGSL